MVAEEALKLSYQAGSERPQVHCKISDLYCSMFAVGRPHLPESTSKCGNESGMIFGLIMWERRRKIP